MLTQRQTEILNLLKEQPFVPAKELYQKLELTRARVQQIISPLVRKGLIKREGRARATIYRLTAKPNEEIVRRENWELKQKVRQLTKELEDRKVIERAKELLIAQFDLRPTDAYRKMQERSMASGRSLRQIADELLQALET